ncbi:MAG: phenylalanine--tRNA ligase subunit beta [Oscillospiraceae bacterium]|nr:phenylalanine--tRNA ligase subunit beta [Oscillospiraceae bacterium]
MKCSRNWLKEFVDIHADDKAYAETMTLSGSKVESTECPAAEMKNVVVGYVATMEPHPDSDHMFICGVEVGGRTVQIVTGAQNVNVGNYVPTALHGSVLPGGVHIETGVLRGVESCGMLCSLKELGLTTHDFPYAIEDGIFILNDDPDLAAAGFTSGAEIGRVLGMDDHTVEFEITPNRPDCLSMIGLARESAATFDVPLALHTPAVKGCGGNIAALLDIEVEDPDLCPRYTARMVKNVKIAPSPKWMRERLRACGVRPINNIVDITNYVMLEYGQPMHAFDFSCVEGGKILVRTAREGETIETLDGNTRALTPSMLCICDTKKPVGVAGVMGGANSEIVGDTAMVVFESATFNGVSVRRTATALGMRTDASSRYEKGLDPMNTYNGVQRACELVELLGCGEVVDGILDIISADNAPVILQLEPDKINALLGTAIAADEMRAMLARLGFCLEGNAVTVPSWRSDVEHYSDLAEEVARLYGYDRIPVTLMRGETTQGGFSARQAAERLAATLCRSTGYSEIITYSFISPAYYDKIRLSADSEKRKSITILNPLGEDTSVMRTTALPSMLEILARNYSYRNPVARLYELAMVYRPHSGSALADESTVLSLGAYGGDCDFFSCKGELEAVLAGMNVERLAFKARRDIPAFHPGRCAEVFSGDTPLGIIGQLHPVTCANYGMDDTDVFAAQLDFAALLSCRTLQVHYQPLPRFPDVTRDIAVVCDAAIPVAELTACIRRGAGSLLKKTELFDIYTGAPIPEGQKSVAFALSLRADDRTLTDAQADTEVSGILDLLKTELGAVLR